jgi:hypothetical protein
VFHVKQSAAHEAKREISPIARLQILKVFHVEQCTQLEELFHVERFGMEGNSLLFNTKQQTPNPPELEAGFLGSDCR